MTRAVVVWPIRHRPGREFITEPWVFTIVEVIAYYDRGILCHLSDRAQEVFVTYPNITLTPSNRKEL